MPDTTRNELARVLADIDQCLARAERIAADPDHEDHDAAVDFLIEFQTADKDADRRFFKAPAFSKFHCACE
jgi:hypothetical protein